MLAWAKLRRARIQEPSSDGSSALGSPRVQLHHLNEDALAAIVEHLAPDAFANLLLASKTTHSLLQQSFPMKAIFSGSSMKERKRLKDFYFYMLRAPETRGPRLKELVVGRCVTVTSSDPREDERRFLCEEVLQILEYTPNLRVLELNATNSHLSPLDGTSRSQIAIPLFAGLNNLSVLRLDDCCREFPLDAFQDSKACLKHVEMSTSADKDVVSALAPVSAHLLSMELWIKLPRPGSTPQPPQYIFQSVMRLSLKSYLSDFFHLALYASQFPNITHLSIHCDAHYHSPLLPTPLGSWPLLISVEGDWLSVDALSLPPSLRKLRLYLPPLSKAMQMLLPESSEQLREDALARVLHKGWAVAILELKLETIPKRDVWFALYEMKNLRTLQIICGSMRARKDIENVLVSLTAALFWLGSCCKIDRLFLQMKLLATAAKCSRLTYLYVSFLAQTPVTLEKKWLVDCLIRPLAACSQSIRYVECPEAKASWELRRQGYGDLMELSLGEAERVRRSALDEIS